eukprot:CFRG7797T1
MFYVLHVYFTAKPAIKHGRLFHQLKMTSLRWRVKVYNLDAESAWIDQGCGFTSLTADTKNPEVQLLSVESEEADHAQLLSSRVESSKTFVRQQGTLIVWQEPEGVDVALSFQEVEGCVEIYNKLTELQEHTPVDDRVDTQPADNNISEDLDDISFLGSDMEITLPVVELATLNDIAQAIELAVDMPLRYSRDALATQIVIKNYVRDLLDVFEQCEELESIDDLHTLCRIFTGMFLLNIACVTEVLIEGDTLMKVIGALEYDPAQPKARKHREFLTNQVKFREAVPLPNEAIVEKVHQTYRLQYLKDVVLVRQADDSAYTTITSFIFFGGTEIATALSQDDEFLDSLFAPLNGPAVTPQTSCNIVLFLKELVALSKSMQMVLQITFFEKLNKRGFLDCLCQLLNHPETVARQGAAELFVKALNHDPAAVRKHIIRQYEQHSRSSLLQKTIRAFIADVDNGTKTLCGECLRITLDTDTMGAEKFEFLNKFYDESFDELISPLVSAPADPVLHSQYINKKHNSIYSIIEILTYLMGPHTTFMKPKLLRSNVIHKVTMFLKESHMYLSLGVLRFLRSLIALKDEAVLKYMQKHDVFGIIIHAYVNNGQRYNMLDSAIAELFEYIKMENFKSTIKYVVEHYRTIIDTLKNPAAFKNLYLKYDQNEEVGAYDNDRLEENDQEGSALQHTIDRYRPDARQMDADEENWFDDDDSVTETEQLLVSIDAYTKGVGVDVAVVPSTNDIQPKVSELSVEPKVELANTTTSTVLNTPDDSTCLSANGTTSVREEKPQLTDTNATDDTASKQSASSVRGEFQKKLPSETSEVIKPACAGTEIDVEARIVSDCSTSATQNRKRSNSGSPIPVSTEVLAKSSESKRHCVS